MMAAALTDQGNIWAGFRKNRDSWFPRIYRRSRPGHKAKAVYFAGCTASYVEQDIGMATVRLLDAAGVDFTYLGKKENCCGTPMLVAGKWTVFERRCGRTSLPVKAAGGGYGDHLCPACNI
jgi:Fe-S oxidoreductase